MKLRSNLYFIARLIGDITAIFNGRILQRIFNKGLGRMLGKLFIRSAIIIILIPGTLLAGDLTVGVSNIPSAHSESKKDRCLNYGGALDIGWDWTPLELDFNKYLGLQLKAGLLGTYSSIQSAYREKAANPMSNRRNESAITLLGVLKPTIKIWRFSPHLMLGAGPDWSTAEGFDIGYLEYGVGLYFEISENIGIGYSQRKFNRAGTFYKYQTIGINITF